MELIEWFIEREQFIKEHAPVKLACGLITDVEYFVKIQMLRIQNIGGKEGQAATDRLTELKNILEKELN